MTAREPATRRGRCPLREAGLGRRITGRARRQDGPDSGREKGALMRIRDSRKQVPGLDRRAPAP